MRDENTMKQEAELAQLLRKAERLAMEIEQNHWPRRGVDGKISQMIGDAVTAAEESRLTWKLLIETNYHLTFVNEHAIYAIWWHPNANTHLNIRAHEATGADTPLSLEEKEFMRNLYNNHRL
jgi:hypothetical protein